MAGRYLYLAAVLVAGAFAGFLLSGTASAQSVGTACSVGQTNQIAQVGGPDFSSVGHFVVCDGSNWRGLIEWQNSTGRSFSQIAKDTGGCTSQKTGRLSYDEATDTWTYCNGSNWLPFEHAGGGGPTCSVFGRTPGYVCPDETVFAGYAPPTYEPIFTTRCDAGQSWNGSACTGTASTPQWSAANVLRGATSGTDGKANTALLTDPPRVPADHPAASYCASLDYGGHTDWYLPAMSELITMFFHRAAINNFSANSYWSSTEYTSTVAIGQIFSGETTSYDYPKNATYVYMRCVRKNE